MFTCKKNKPTPEELQKSRYLKEEELMKFYGLDPFINFHIFDVTVTWQEKQYKVHTFKGGDLNKQTIVLLHGYGGSNAHYCRVYKKLCQKFRVISIDLPGMGFSSKEINKDISINNYEDTIQFFMQVIELWRQELGLVRFSLAGHSFGGYIAAQYSVHYPEFIQQLFLLSPAGTTNYSEIELQQMQNFESQPFMKRVAIKYFQSVWGSMTTPQQVGNRWYGKYLINKYLSKRMQLSGRELELWKAYTEELINLPEGSEKGLFILFQFPRVVARISIEQLISENYERLRFPIVFYYGGHDWMDDKGAKNLAAQYPTIRRRIVQQAGHQLNFENADGLTQMILEDYIENRELCAKYKFDLDDDKLLIGSAVEEVKEFEEVKQFEEEEAKQYEEQEITLIQFGQK